MLCRVLPAHGCAVGQGAGIGQQGSGSGFRV